MNLVPPFGLHAKSKYVLPISVRFMNGVRNLLFSSICAKSRSIAFARDDRTEQWCTQENIAKLIALTAEEFSTTEWVRCRSGAKDAAQSNPKSQSKSIKLRGLETLCDKNTWHWVCNHK